jgi:hypothetical protein
MMLLARHWGQRTRTVLGTRGSNAHGFRLRDGWERNRTYTVRLWRKRRVPRVVQERPSALAPRLRAQNSSFRRGAKMSIGNHQAAPCSLDVLAQQALSRGLTPRDVLAHLGGGVRVRHHSWGRSPPWLGYRSDRRCTRTCRCRLRPLARALLHSARTHASSLTASTFSDPPCCCAPVPALAKCWTLVGQALALRCASYAIVRMVRQQEPLRPVDMRLVLSPVGF